MYLSDNDLERQVRGHSVLCNFFSRGASAESEEYLRPMNDVCYPDGVDHPVRSVLRTALRLTRADHELRVADTVYFSPPLAENAGHSDRSVLYTAHGLSDARQAQRRVSTVSTTMRTPLVEDVSHPWLDSGAR